MEFILLIHNNARQSSTEEQWNLFFCAARQSGFFAGGSELKAGEVFGAKSEPVSVRLGGYMRFKTDGSADELKKIHQLLQQHPTVLQGGSVELCELPRS